MSETVGNSPFPESFGEVIELIGRVVAPYSVHDITRQDGGGWELTSTVGSFDTRIIPFNLPIGLTKKIGTGTFLRGRVVGTIEEGDGVTILVRSINPFKRGAYGFYIQPKPQEADGPDISDSARGYEVWEGPASWPDRGEVPRGMYLLNSSTAMISDAPTCEDLIRTFQRHAANHVR
jgi:hypothetical protein